MKKTEQVREQIVETADKRFRDYGYTKTTMAEIANDLKMSAANLYRFYRSKHEIAAACAERCLGERGECLNEVVIRDDLSASDKLLEFVLADIRYTHEQDNQPKINELIEIVTREHKELVLSKLNSQCALIAEILGQGNMSGEFYVADIEKSARAILSSLTLFELPIFVSLYSEQQLRVLAVDLVELLLAGLRKR